MTLDHDDHNEALARAKAILRLKGRAARRAVGPEARHAAAYALAERVLTLPEMDGARSVLLYGSSPEEADPGVLEWALRDNGIRIAYPRVAGPYELMLHWVDDASVLRSGSYGLKEPVADAPRAHLAEIDLVVVPGIAFDARGNRLGFGGGYYDTLLGDGDDRPFSVGFAYDEQVVAEVPHEDRDRPVDVLVTPTRTYRCITNET
ncbi:MAG: 5-formyltetrahydrofolate cyclo-ligase [Aeromicrobium sp.]|jgi:5-formyltetrahydrofolate cyclo-ligase|nr:5-formyltetrahydrofolate cyclo-ligase [Aeromicrobium sp.]